MRILIITYKYVPLIAPRVFRWSSIIREWVKNSIDVDVICAVEPGCPDYEIIDGANVYRVKPWLKKVIKPDRQPRDTEEHIRGFLLSNKVEEKPFGHSNTSGDSAPSFGEDVFTLEHSDNDDFGQDENSIDPAQARLDLQVEPQEEFHIAINDEESTSPSDEAVGTISFGVVVKVLKRTKRIFLRFVRALVCIQNRSIQLFKRMIVRLKRNAIQLLRKAMRYAIRNVRLAKRKFSRTKTSLQKTIRDFLWPDYGMSWIPPATLRARKLLRENHYDAIISVSWPVSPHVVGWVLSRWFAKSIPWVVDIGDPFSFNYLTPINDFKKYAKLNYRFENSLLQRSSYITVTTGKTKQEYEKQFSVEDGKIHVIPPLVSINPVRSDNASSLFLKDECVKRLVYTGSLRRNNRRPEPLLELFSQLIAQARQEKLELHIFGDVKQCMDSFLPYRHLLDQNLFLHGIVSKDIVDQAIFEADVLVNIGNVSEHQLPSKIVEYLASNKPVINVATSENDSSWEVLSVSPLAINIYAPKMSDMVDRALQFILTPPAPLSEPELEQLIGAYKVSAVSRMYLELLRT